MYLGHYRVVKYSLRVLWVSVITSDLLTTFGSSSIYKTKIVPTLQCVSLVTFSNWVLINCLMLLHPKIHLFNWHIWAYFLAIGMFLLSSSCFCGLYTDSISLLIPATVCSVSVICEFFQQPVKTNPIKQIYQVMKYAAKNKYPRLRSAFAYWEDKPYSRINLGKSKYGGPLTTEQVEGVKACFRILLVVILTTINIFVYIYSIE